MSNFFKITSFLLVFLMLVFYSCYAADVGAMAPDFALKDTYGTEHKLSDFRGKYVVLEWFNPDCPFVKKHYDSGNMQALQEKYTDQGIIWLSINSSAPGKQGHYSQEEFNNITKASNASPTYVLPDADGTVGRLYGAKTTPHIFIISEQGRLIYEGAIDSIASTNSGDISEAENYVEMVFDNLGEGKGGSPSSTRPYGCSVKY